VDRNARKGVKSTHPTLTIDILDYYALLRSISFFGGAGSGFLNRLLSAEQKTIPGKELKRDEYF
jgi:hypothetical protein